MIGRLTGALLCLLVSPVVAQESAQPEAPRQPVRPEDGTFSLKIENDLVNDTDRDYTHGTQFTWLSPEIQGEHWARRLIETVPGLTYGDRLRYSLSVGQSIFTPRDTQTSRRQKDDRPYAGWLYLGLAAVAYDARYQLLQSLALDVGVVGPPAMGRQVQNSVHRLISAPEAEGWQHQLRTEPGIQLSYERKWRQFHHRPFGDRFGIDLMPHVGAALGNVATYAGAGASWRVGFDLEEDFGPPRIRPSLPGSTFFKVGGLSGYVFLGLEGRGVARDIFLDGNTFGGGHSVSRRWFVGELQAGAAVSYENVRLAYTQVYRTPQIRNRDKGDRFGALTLSWRVRF
ncbi:lipid A deacylase LpxR family protein [Aquibaculum sediminis]|uniref:lipid A deacylase LpxR family protein n=1 Tax=Aquibaculum sediminis TaxID=3231907 RepID=UPI00345341B2